MEWASRSTDLTPIRHNARISAADGILRGYNMLVAALSGCHLLSYPALRALKGAEVVA